MDRSASAPLVKWVTQARTDCGSVTRTQVRARCSSPADGSSTVCAGSGCEPSPTDSSALPYRQVIPFEVTNVGIVCVCRTCIG